MEVVGGYVSVLLRAVARTQISTSQRSFACSLFNPTNALLSKDLF